MATVAHVIPGMVMCRDRPPTPAQIIFNRLYRIRIAGIHLIDERVLEQFGTVTTGSRQDDIAIAAAPMFAHATIAGMATFLSDGATFELESTEKAHEIFEVIQQHLLAWSASIDQSFNRRDAPMEGLRELERLAEYLYPVAMRYKAADQHESHLYRGLRDIIRRRGGAKLPTVQETPKEPTQSVESLRSYYSIADDMTKALQKRENPWN